MSCSGIARLTIHSQKVVVGCYVIIFGLGRLGCKMVSASLTSSVATAGLEFQQPPYIARYASFYFSFLGRGICMW